MIYYTIKSLPDEGAKLIGLMIAGANELSEAQDCVNSFVVLKFESCFNTGFGLRSGRFIKSNL